MSVKVSIIVVLSILFQFAESRADETVALEEKIDTSEMLKTHLGIDGMDLNKIDVAMGMKRKDLTTKVNTAILYRLYGTISETFPDALDDRYIKYNGDMITKEVIVQSKDFLKRNAVVNTNENLRAMSYFSLGHAFAEDHSVVVWLFGQFLQSDLSIDERAAVLDALDTAAGETFKYISSMAFRVWLRSDDEKEAQKVLYSFLINGEVKVEYLPDLLADLLNEKGGLRYNNRLVKVLKLYRAEELLPYYELLSQAMSLRPENIALGKFYSWLEEQQ